MINRLIFPLGFALSGVLVLSSAGCSAHDLTSNSNDPDSAIQDESPRPPARTACYPGADQRVCFETLRKDDLTEQVPLYGYPDPYTDPTFPKSFNKAMYRAPDRLLDLRRIDWRQALAPHFERYELIPDGAKRGSYGLFSTATVRRLENLRNAIERPMMITSGYRSPGHNSTIPGAAKWSRHTYGDAVDFKVSGLSYKDLADLCVQHGASYYQLYSDHVHCDWRGLAGDSAFFPETRDLHFKSTREAVLAESRIVLRTEGLDAASSTLVLEADVLKEDGGELLHEWTVTDDRGQLYLSEEPLLILPKLPGTYRIRVRVGGSLVLHREVIVP